MHVHICVHIKGNCSFVNGLSFAISSSVQNGYSEFINIQNAGLHSIHVSNLVLSINMQM